VVPAGQWVVVSWSHRANSAADRELALRLWRATATAGTYTLVGTGSLRTLAPGGINTFYERIPVAGGDLLGLRVGNPPSGAPLDFGGGASCAFTAPAGNTIRYSVLSSEPAAGSDAVLSASLPAYRLNLTARLEPDADADGYGDETQDGCPTAAGTAGGCAPPVPPGTQGPDTTVPKLKLSGPRDSIRDGRVGFWLTPSEIVTATATGTLTIGSHARAHRLRAVSTTVLARGRTLMMLKMTDRTRRAARRALRRGRKLRARVSVTVRDDAGNSASAKGSVRLAR
jgi:hypothetical protein